MTDDVQINLTLKTQARLDELAREMGRSADDLVEDALVGCLDEVAHLREALDSRYDALKSGRVAAIDRNVALAHLREKSRVRRSERHE
jgi:predicted transcriptional regulator